MSINTIVITKQMRDEYEDETMNELFEQYRTRMLRDTSEQVEKWLQNYNLYECIYLMKRKGEVKCVTA